MTWTKYFELDQAKIKDMYLRNQSWGELITYLWIADSQYLYGIGWYQSGTTGVPKYGSPIPVTFAAIGDKKCRIDVDSLAMVGIGSTGEAYTMIYALKGEDPVMPYILGVGVSITSPPNRNIGIPFKVSLVIEGKKMSVYVDNEKIRDIDLSDVPDKVKIGVYTIDVNGSMGCMFTYISASYYDVIAGLMQQIMSILPMIMWIMIGVMVVSLLVRAFASRRGERRAERERR
ncbi:MAG: hypothetical protein QXF17_05645 [Ignisphaera sp.]